MLWFPCVMQDVCCYYLLMPHHIQCKGGTDSKKESYSDYFACEEKALTEYGDSSVN